MFVKVALFLLLSVEIESCGSPHYSPPHFKRNGQQEGQSGEVNMDQMMGRMGTLNFPKLGPIFVDPTLCQFTKYSNFLEDY